MELQFRTMYAEDWPAVERIYFQGIETGDATFQTESPTWKEWDHGHISVCRIVAVANERVVGWAALSPVSERCAYDGVAEVSIYIDNTARGQKVGKRLLERLIAESEKENFWTLQSGIFPENKASIALHLACGFRTVGYRERVGKLNGVWRDTVLMERRSNKVGLD